MWNWVVGGLLRDCENRFLFCSISPFSCSPPPAVMDSQYQNITCHCLHVTWYSLCRGGQYILWYYTCVWKLWVAIQSPMWIIRLLAHCYVKVNSKLCCVNLKIDRKLISKVVTSCIDNPAEKMIAVGIIWLESTDCDRVGIGWVVGKQHWSNISNLPGPGWCFVRVFLVHNLSNNL